MTHQPDNSQQRRFMQLYEPCHSRLTRFVRSLVWQTEDARDLMAETVLQAWQGYYRLRDEQSFLAYLFGIAYRLIRQYERKKHRWRFFSVSEAELVPDPGSNPETGVDLSIFYKAVARLKPRERETLMLFEVSGLSLKEIQDIQGDSLSAVKSRLVRAREKLQRMMGHFPSQPGEIKPSMTAKEQDSKANDNMEHQLIIVMPHAANGR